MTVPKPPALTAIEIADLVGGVLENPREGLIEEVADCNSAQPHQAAFLAEGRTLECSGEGPGLLFVTPNMEVNNRPCVRVAHPALAAAILKRHFHPRRTPEPGIHSSAIIDPSSSVSDEAEIAPGCVIGPRVVIEAGCFVGPRVTIGEDCFVGAETHLHAGVTLYSQVHLESECVVHAGTVLGAAGFGYVWSGSEHVSVPQTGSVWIGKGCEIGANTCIDRGTFEATRLGQGCIVDNLVQIGHNCVLGNYVVLCGRVALGGSTTIEDGAMLGGAAGSGGHLTIGAGAQLAAGCKVFRDVPAGAKLGGNPGIELSKHLRAAIRRAKG
ncbi:MAG: UDP-3-O-(3-hydroxymyristoyl)glucosamine N-acyltransferase [Planctomycetes bacterium]|nr:UDP-3-O-(3-hydroxymyristoyl)glucosamine N-acyltransferase [Planctomycetota bacterium]